MALLLPPPPAYLWYPVERGHAGVMLDKTGQVKRWSKAPLILILSWQKVFPCFHLYPSQHHALALYQLSRELSLCDFSFILHSSYPGSNNFPTIGVGEVIPFSLSPYGTVVFIPVGRIISLAFSYISSSFSNYSIAFCLVSHSCDCILICNVLIVFIIIRCFRLNLSSTSLFMWMHLLKLLELIWTN